MSQDLLRPDCSKCVGLCCVALAFDRSALFAFDKAAGEPCRNLDSAYRCTIHDRLADSGFGGCVQFDCLGAGQRATALFPQPRLGRPIFDAFAKMRTVHQLLELLDGASRLQLDASERQHCAALSATLSADWTLPQFLALDLAAVEGQVRTFLTGLQTRVAPATR